MWNEKYLLVSSLFLHDPNLSNVILSTQRGSDGPQLDDLLEVFNSPAHLSLDFVFVSMSMHSFSKSTVCLLRAF